MKNKIDAVDEETIDNYQKQFAKITNAEILTISAVTGAGLTTLLLASMLSDRHN